MEELSSFRDLLEESDFFGNRGTTWFKPRSNLVLDIQGTRTELDAIKIFGNILHPMGASFEQFTQGIFPQMPDEPLGFMPIDVLWENHEIGHPTTGKHLLWNVAEQYPYKNAHWTFDIDSELFAFTDMPGGPVRLLELCSGGHGGWAYAARFIRSRPIFGEQKGIQIMAIDHDWHAVANYAAIHGAIAVDGSKKINGDIMNLGHDVVICADITGKHWQQIAATWRPDVATISAPCVSWSSAGSTTGLAATTGILLAEAIACCKRLRPKIVAIEQVPGFIVHKHAKLIINQLKAVGYVIKWSHVVDANAYGCASRRRWLCIAFLNHAEGLRNSVIPKWIEKAPQTPQSMDSIVQWQQQEVQHLAVTQEVIALAKRADLLPPAARALCLPSGQAALNYRCSKGDKTLGTFMAMYGSQHVIEESKMKQKGFLAHFLSTEEGLRYWHPIEIGLHHCVWDCIFTGHQLEHSWKFEGNQIAMPHALFVLGNALNMLAKAPAIDVMQLMESMWNERLRATNSCHRRLEVGYAIESSESDRFKDPFNHNFQQLLKACEVGHFASDVAWSATTGFFSLQQHSSPPYAKVGMLHPSPQSIRALPEEPASVIETVTTQQNGMEETQIFRSMQKARIFTDDGMFFFWFDNTLPVDRLPLLWNCIHEVKILNQEDCCQGSAIELLVCKNESIHSWSYTTEGCEVVLIQDSQVSVYHSERGMLLQDLIHNWGIHQPLFDQFGKIDHESLSRPSLLCVQVDTSQNTKVPSEMPTFVDPIMVIAALQQSSIVTEWNQQDFSFVIKGVGSRSTGLMMSAFWSNLVSRQELFQWGYSVLETSNETEFHVAFAPTATTNPLPPNLVWIRIAVLATRFVMNHLESPTGIPFTLKWFSRPLWKGYIDGSVTAQQLESLLHLTMQIAMYPAEPRLIHKGQRCTGPFKIADMQPSKDGILCHVMSSLHGGGKEQNRTQAKNSIASTLLEQGYDLKWVSETAETLISKCGLQKASQVAILPGGKQRHEQVMQLCQDCAIEIPKNQEKKMQKMTTHAAQQKARRQHRFTPDPADYRIEVGYVKNADGTNALQLDQIRSMASGLCIMTADQAIPWLRENRTISKDELAMFVLGTPNQITSLKTEDIMLPCRNTADQQVILAGTLVQLGSKQMEISKQTTQDIKIQNCQTVALTVWKEDWADQDWNQFLKATMPTFRQHLGEEGTEAAVLALWGRSLRHQNKPADDRHATSIQIHCSVQQDHLNALLVKSGFCKIYATPKNAAGKFSDKWRIIWITGDLAHVTGVASQTVACCGLVKGKSSYGLRFAQDHFEAAWGIINPHERVPQQIGGEHIYRIEPLPYGCNTSSIQEWGKLQKWDIKAIKAVGPRAWIIASQSHPPPGVLTFNGNPVIAQFIVPKSIPQSKVVMAGPKPKERIAGGDQNLNNASLSTDPWATYRNRHGLSTPGPGVSQTRTVEGPIEAQFKTQEARIASLEHTMQKLQDSQQTLESSTKEGFQKVAEREEDTRKFVSQALDTTKKDIQLSVEQALTKQAQSLSSSLDELKSLFKSQPKRARSQEDDEMDGY